MLIMYALLLDGGFLSANDDYEIYREKKRRMVDCAILAFRVSNFAKTLSVEFGCDLGACRPDRYCID